MRFAMRRVCRLLLSPLPSLLVCAPRQQHGSDEARG
jgi:hypothetical protein